MSKYFKMIYTYCIKLFKEYTVIACQNITKEFGKNKPPRPFGPPLRGGEFTDQFFQIYSLIKAEKRFANQRLRCLAGNPFVRNEQKIVGGQRTNV